MLVWLFSYTKEDSYKGTKQHMPGFLTGVIISITKNASN